MQFSVRKRGAVEAELRKAEMVKARQYLAISCWLVVALAVARYCHGCRFQINGL
ncbi:hypothetical protein BDV98DRAFT_567316 [Pterulicium gracile]|uniref:Uncharacterized protein n=1 Tax=Pterulicium gracile TaxID=1884261 RepID=A0A5C3QN27_9AGAR|nr:hypothetical protein BDV98DRAFT_567316 [Pterula gracilis]